MSEVEYDCSPSTVIQHNCILIHFLPNYRGHKPAADRASGTPLQGF